jgi:hypothetical protein
LPKGGWICDAASPDTVALGCVWPGRSMGGGVAIASLLENGLT